MRVEIEGLNMPLEFPDDTPMEVIQSTVKRLTSGMVRTDDKPFQQGVDQLAKEKGIIDTGLTAFGRGLVGLGRAVGLVDKEDPYTQKAYEALQKERPITTMIGETAGESAPFAAVPIGAIPGTLARAGAALGLGAIEGGLVARAHEGDNTQQMVGAGLGGLVAGGAELALPYVGRFVGQAFRRLTGRAPRGALLTAEGLPTKELSEALTSAGMKFDDLTAEALDSLKGMKPGTDPVQAARKARFDELEIPHTSGDITQDFNQQALEARLVESAADPVGEVLRSRRLEQSDRMADVLFQGAGQAGDAGQVGQSIKNALEGRQAALRETKNALYQKAGEAAEQIGGIPLLTDEISAAIPDMRVTNRLKRLNGSQSEAVLDLLAEFGIDRSEGALKRLEAMGIEPEPLSLANFDDFRMALGQIEQADPTKAASVIAGPVRQALDKVADEMGETLAEAGIPDDVLTPLKQARATVRQLKTEFDPKDIVGKLVANKPKSNAAMTEASQVYKNIVGGGEGKPIEYLQKTVNSLQQAGDEGRQALGNLQAATIMDLVDSAFKANTRKIRGTPQFGTTAFSKRVRQIGDDRLKLIFQSNPEAYRAIKKISQISADITPDSRAVPKGSASVILDMLNRTGITTILGRIPLGGLFVERFAELAEKGANRRVVTRALEAKPELRQTLNLIERQMPNFARAAGIAGLTSTMGEGETNNASNY